jgi:hypothetical protein
VLQRKKHDKDDLEASAGSPSQSSYLITPLTDDDSLPGSSKAEGANGQSIEHQDSIAIIKNKTRKGSKKIAGENPGGQESLPSGSI